MSKGGNRNDGFSKFKDKKAKKRIRKKKSNSTVVMEYMTVQPLSSNAEGRYQKYAGISALTIDAPLGREPIIHNIKEANLRLEFYRQR